MRLRHGLCLIVVGLLVVGGCARDGREITPTTLGTDLKRMPRGEMKSYPWPGVDLVKTRARPDASTRDPDASLASGPSRKPGG